MTRTGSSTGTRVLAAETTLTAVGNTTTTGTLELHELSTNGNHKISISAPNSLDEAPRLVPSTGILCSQFLNILTLGLIPALFKNSFDSNK